MSWFDTILIQPIFNILLFLYSVIPGNDFGVSLVIFAVLFRLLMWPLVRKQLHQSQLQRKIQPELKKIKAKAKGNKQLEGQMMLELYKERGVNPFAPFGVLLIQLPIFIALFHIARFLSSDRSQIVNYTYSFMADWFAPVAAVVANPAALNENFLGLIDLTKSGFADGTFYLPVVLLAAVSAFLQYYQSKQVSPRPADNKRLRDILKEASAGKEADQSEISAIMAQRMLVIIPFFAFSVSIIFPGALVLFYAVSSLVAVVQQQYMLREEIEELGEIASEPTKKKSARKQVTSTATTIRPSKAKSTSTKSTKAKASPTRPVSSGAKPVRSIPKPEQKRRKGSKVK